MLRGIPQVDKAEDFTSGNTNPDKNHFSDDGWDLLAYLSNRLPDTFKSITDSIRDKPFSWRNILTAENPFIAKYPDTCAGIENFSKLIVAKAFNP